MLYLSQAGRPSWPLTARYASLRARLRDAVSPLEIDRACKLAALRLGFGRGEWRARFGGLPESRAWCTQVAGARLASVRQKRC
jgi:hypothetical protein